MTFVRQNRGDEGCSRSAPFGAAAGQLGDEGGVFGAGEAERQDGEDTFEIPRQQGGRVQP